MDSPSSEQMVKGRKSDFFRTLSVNVAQPASELVGYSPAPASETGDDCPIWRTMWGLFRDFGA